MKLLVIASVNVFPSRVHFAGPFIGNLVDRLSRLIDKVVVISPRPWAPRYVSYISKQLRRSYPPIERRGRVLVVRPQHLPLYLRKHSNWLSYAVYRGSLGLAERLHKKHRFDAVLGIWFPINTYAAVRIAERIGKPCATFAIGRGITVEPLISKRNMAVTRKIIRKSSLVLTDSDAMGVTVRGYCPDAKNVRTYYMGIDLSFLDKSTESREQLRKQLRIAPGNKCLITVGRIVRTKGIWEFLEAFKILAGKYENLQGIMVGGGLELEPLRQAIDEAGLAGRLTVTGVVDRVEIGRFVKAADLMLFPTHHEGVPDTVKEALAAELPVVVTDVDGNPELVKHERTGLLVPVKDVPAMVQAVERMFENPDFARATAQAGRQLVLKEHDVDRNVLHMRDMLERLIADPANAGERIAAEAVSES